LIDSNQPSPAQLAAFDILYRCGHLYLYAGRWEALCAAVVPATLLSSGFFMVGIWITVTIYKKYQPIGCLVF
tara:strand:+ start:445 stop:660 length:216 start_codon:yes stop_codon:yes gene_type:complete